MFAEQLRRGSIINGRRVAGMCRGRMNGQAYIFVELESAKRGKRGERLEFRVGTRVPGTRPRTDLPAGPVRATRAPMLMAAVGRRDGEDARDRHSRLIDNIVYA